MKKFFTFGICLFLILGIGNKMTAATITAAVPLTDNTWTNTANWVGGVVPTYADDVIIPAGDSIATTATTYCNSLTVNGTFYNGATFYVNGNITVNTGGVYNIHSTLYCYNVYNYGKFWNPSQPYGGSPKNLILGAGFTYNGTTYATAYGTADYVFQNDGIVGAPRAKALASSGNGGPGIYIYYSNLAKSITIQPSSPTVTGTIFTIGALAPFNSGTAATQDFTLNIKQSIALLRYSTVFSFSLQNGDAFSGTRTCNIFAGDTVFVNGNFHARGSAPTASQGSMIYNINGCLDLTSLAITNSVNSMDLYTSATSPSITVNINTGGALNIGKAVKMVASAASGQTIVINPSNGSSVIFGQPTGLTATTAFTLTNATLPSSFGNLAINNSYGITLPNNPTVSGNLSLTAALNNIVTLNGTSAQTVTGGGQTITGGLTINNTSGNVSLASALSVTGALTLTSGKLLLGNNNLTVGSTAGASSSSYVVTDGSGTLTVPAAATATTAIPVGASTASYDPVSVSPSTSSNFSVRAYSTLTGLPVYGVRYNQKEWDINPVTASSTVIALTPSNLVESVSSPVIGHYVSGSYVNSTATMTNGNTTFTGTFDTFSPFVTGANVDVTKVDNVNTGLVIYSSNNMLIVRNANPGDLVTVYAANGAKVASSVISSNNTSLPVSKGFYVVKTGSTIQKVLVQ